MKQMVSECQLALMVLGVWQLLKFCKSNSFAVSFLRQVRLCGVRRNDKQHSLRRSLHSRWFFLFSEVSWHTTKIRFHIILHYLNDTKFEMPVLLVCCLNDLLQSAVAHSQTAFCVWACNGAWDCGVCWIVNKRPHETIRNVQNSEFFSRQKWNCVHFIEIWPNMHENILVFEMQLVQLRTFCSINRNTLMKLLCLAIKHNCPFCTAEISKLTCLYIGNSVVAFFEPECADFGTGFVCHETMSHSRVTLDNERCIVSHAQKFAVVLSNYALNLDFIFATRKVCTHAHREIWRIRHRAISL